MESNETELDRYLVDVCRGYGAGRLIVRAGNYCTDSEVYDLAGCERSFGNGKHKREVPVALLGVAPPNDNPFGDDAGYLANMLVLSFDDGDKAIDEPRLARVLDKARLERLLLTFVRNCGIKFSCILAYPDGTVVALPFHVMGWEREPFMKEYEIFKKECEAERRYQTAKLLKRVADEITTNPILEQVKGEVQAAYSTPTVALGDGQGESSKALDDIKNGVAEILREMQQQRIEQGETQGLLEAIRRVLGYVLKAGLPADAETKKRLDEIYQAITSDMSFRQKLELSLPIIPFLLEYHAEVEAGVDIGAAVQEFQEHLRKDQNKR